VRVPTPPSGAPTRFGLFSASTLIEGADGHQLAGIEYPAVCSTRVDPWAADCAWPPPPEGTVAATKQPQPTRAMTAASPFVLYAMDDCALGVDMADQQAALRQRFTTGERHAVENIVATGLLNNYPRLVGTEANPTVLLQGTTGTGADQTVNADPLAQAIGKLEHWLAATTGGAGVIHVPRWLANDVKQESLTTTSGPVMASVLGNTFAFGSGYAGGPPASAPAAEQEDTAVWLYATRPVTIRRSELIEPADWTTGAFDTRTNTGALLVERVYVVDWPCAAAAVKVRDIDRWELPDAYDLARPTAHLPGRSA